MHPIYVERNIAQVFVSYSLHYLRADGTPDLSTSFSAEGYSKYWERIHQRDEEWKEAFEAGKDTSFVNKIDPYGLDQVLEHKAELEAKNPGYTLVVVRTTQIIEIAPLPAKLQDIRESK